MKLSVPNVYRREINKNVEFLVRTVEVLIVAIKKVTRFMKHTVLQSTKEEQDEKFFPFWNSFNRRNEYN